MPENGVWSSDRLQLTAYSILVEEKYNSVVEKGFVEYVRWGHVRPVIIKRHERRKVLQVRINKKNTGRFYARKTKRCTMRVLWIQRYMRCKINACIQVLLKSEFCSCEVLVSVTPFKALILLTTMSLNPS